MSDNSWRYEAKCANDPVIQFELKNRYDRFHDKHGRSIETIAYCKGTDGSGPPCPVMEQCLNFAISLEDSDPHNRNVQAYGIWGGTTRTLRSQRHRRAEKKKKAQQTQILNLVEQMKAQFQDTYTPTEGSTGVPA